MIDGVVALKDYAKSTGISVEKILHRAASGELTLCWEILLAARMQPVVEFCPCLTQSELQWEGTVWRVVDQMPYGKPLARYGVFRLDANINPVLELVFGLLRQGHSPVPDDCEGCDWDSLVIQDTVDGSWWRILGMGNEFLGGRLPLLGELLIEPLAPATVAELGAFTSKPNQRVEVIRQWFNQQTEFASGQLFKPQSGRAGARNAAWTYFKGKGLTKAGRMFGGVANSEGGPSRSFEEAWSQFKAEMTTTEK